MTYDKQKLDPLVVQLRQARLDVGLKSQEFAEAINMNAATFSGLENGATVKLSVLRTWAYELGFEPILKPTRKHRVAVPSDDLPADLTTVHLSRYQTALASGMLISQAMAARASGSESVADDLQVIADILVRSIR